MLLQVLSWICFTLLTAFLLPYILGFLSISFLLLLPILLCLLIGGDSAIAIGIGIGLEILWLPIVVPQLIREVTGEDG